MRLILLGGPGSGKGTQAQQLCQRLEIPWISTGDILRQAIDQQSELGQKAQPYVEQGELVPDETMIQFIRQRLLQPDVSQGWLLDGYPRTAFQAEELDFLLDELGQKLNWAISLTAPSQVLMERSLSRGRQDDEPEVIQRRIDLFHQRTIPILEYYEPRGRLLAISAEAPPQEVFHSILTGLGL